MRIPQVLPELALVRVLTAGGPYAVGDIVSVAFATPTVGRLVPHTARRELEMDRPADSLIPESISVCVTHAAAPYGIGSILTLSFVDPYVARIHPSGDVKAFLAKSEYRVEHADGREQSALAQSEADASPSGNEFAETAPLAETRMHGQVAGITQLADADEAGIGLRQDLLENRNETNAAFAAFVINAPRDSRRTPGKIEAIHVDSETARDERDVMGRDTSPFIAAGCALEPERESKPERCAKEIERRAGADDGNTRALRSPRATHSGGVQVRLDWNPERVRRFVQVVDKLFTVDRLGWYRHVLAMRLLVPDEITCGDALADIEAVRHLHALRAAAVQTLGRPLLAAFMPSFAVTPEWLDAIDSPAAARALAGLRDAILPHLEDDIEPVISDASDAWTVGCVERSDLTHTPATSVEALLPILIPNRSVHAGLTDRLSAYRRSLIDVFGQTAQSAEAVRLGAMAQPNHSLDDRLWQLVGTIGESFGGLAVA